MPEIACAAGTYTWKYLTVYIYPQTLGQAVSALSSNKTAYTAGGNIPGGSWASPNLYDTLAEAIAASNPPIPLGGPSDGYDVATSVVVGGPDTFANLYPAHWGDGVRKFQSFITPYVADTGRSWETGTEQIYVCGYTATQEVPSTGSDPWTVPQIYIDTVTTMVYHRIIHYYPVHFEVVTVPPISQPPITLQMERNQDSTFTPKDHGVLFKYDNVPGVRVIRGWMDSPANTRTGVIAPAINSGFLLYEEVAGQPSGTVYVYNSNRALVIQIDAAQIGQYLA